MYTHLKNQITHINTKMKIYKIPSLITIIDIWWTMSQTLVYACVHVHKQYSEVFIFLKIAPRISFT